MKEKEKEEFKTNESNTGKIVEEKNDLVKTEMCQLIYYDFSLK